MMISSSDSSLFDVIIILVASSSEVVVICCCHHLKASSFNALKTYKGITIGTYARASSSWCRHTLKQSFPFFLKLLATLYPFSEWFHLFCKIFNSFCYFSILLNVLFWLFHKLEACWRMRNDWRFVDCFTKLHRIDRLVKNPNPVPLLYRVFS